MIRSLRLLGLRIDLWFLDRAEARFREQVRKMKRRHKVDVGGRWINTGGRYFETEEARLDRHRSMIERRRLDIVASFVDLDLCVPDREPLPAVPMWPKSSPPVRYRGEKRHR